MKSEQRFLADGMNLNFSKAKILWKPFFHFQIGHIEIGKAKNLECLEPPKETNMVNIMIRVNITFI